MLSPERSCGAFKIFLFLLTSLLPVLPAFTQSTWYEQRSEHFALIYHKNHSQLVPHILSAAETALSTLVEIFDYEPSETIVIHSNDFSDYGSAGATSVPHNFIRLEVEPLELGYENIPFNERLQWLLAHELVHVVINDMVGRTESLNRSLFSKVPPEKQHPLSIFYSLLTNLSRYSSRWYQEGIAVFMETWLNGGFGRVLGNFDEMYFRARVLENKPFAGPIALEAKDKENSFLLETLSYLYGARFNAYLAAHYGPEKLLSWYSKGSGFFSGFAGKFKSIFGIKLDDAWRNFVQSERAFQTQNLAALKTATLTSVRNLSDEPLGWVTQPFIAKDGRAIIFGNHQAHKLTAINRLDLATRKMYRVGSLPAPSIIQVASTAYNPEHELFFYTTNNNRLYRDIWILDLKTGAKELLFENARVGNLTVSPQTGELWGVRHSSGRAYLVSAEHPYRTLNTLVEFDVGDVLQHLSVSPTGGLLAATLHQASGKQSIIIANTRQIKEAGSFKFQVVTSVGSPEFPSWSPDERYLYWNAFTNGVSNIYRQERGNERIEAMSHTLRGLVRPLYLSEDTLFAFEFTTEGFVPVLIPNEPALRLPAIQYYGEKIIDRAPQVTEWTLKPSPNLPSGFVNGVSKTPYSGISRLQRHAIFPVVDGFREEKVVGLYAHFADPLFTHDLTLRFGISPFSDNTDDEMIHFKGTYDFNKTYKIELEHNASSFYDLFNERKAGTNGTKVTLTHTHYWKFDIPHKLKQTSEFSSYMGIKSINDNLIPVNFPDFFIFQTSTNSRNIRRAIGSVDSEAGHEWTVTALGLGSDYGNLQAAGGMQAEWSSFLTWGRPHNVLHVKLAGGFLENPKSLAIGQFYFGGFDNQTLEDEPVKQYRDTFRFPGVPVYRLSSQRFAKIMFENNLPPIRFGGLNLASHMLTHIDASLFSQGLWLSSNPVNKWLNFGGQINLRFKHWFNLETTLSVGAARAWSWDGGSSDERFISLKLFRD
ncbi:hypothetical protein MJD09_11370 [bacterium]|nr:hypothetical protein [bacterium]